MSLAPDLCPRCKNFLVPCPDCLSPSPAQESQRESIAAPAEVGQGMGAKCCASPRSDCMGILVPSIGNRCSAMHQKGGALLLLLFAIFLFFVFLQHLDAEFPCGFDSVSRMNCQLESGE